MTPVRVDAPRLDAATLRALQRPLKDRYRRDPDSALVTTAVTGRVEPDGIVTTVDTWAGPVRAGLHPATGGDGSLACSADIVLQALVACAGVTLKSVATALGVHLRDATVTASGTWDARGTLGVDQDTPVGLTAVDLVLDLDTDADPATIERLVALTERFCVVARTVAEPTPVTVRHRV